MPNESKTRSLVPDVIVYMGFLLLVSAFNFNSKSANHAWLLLYLGLVGLGILFVRRQLQLSSSMKRSERPAMKFPFFALFLTFVIAIFSAIADSWYTPPPSSWGL